MPTDHTTYAYTTNSVYCIERGPNCVKQLSYLCNFDQSTYFVFPQSLQRRSNRKDNIYSDVWYNGSGDILI